MSETIIVAIITGISAMLGGGALVGYFKDRKKDNATAKLTDVQALQQQVVLLTQISDFLRKENDQLQKDYVESEEARRKMRLRMEELESELQQIKMRCDRMGAQLKEMKGESP